MKRDLMCKYLSLLIFVLIQTQIAYPQGLFTPIEKRPTFGLSMPLSAYNNLYLTYEPVSNHQFSMMLFVNNKKDNTHSFEKRYSGQNPDKYIYYYKDEKTTFNVNTFLRYQYPLNYYNPNFFINIGAIYNHEYYEKSSDVTNEVTSPNSEIVSTFSEHSNYNVNTQIIGGTVGFELFFNPVSSISNNWYYMYRVLNSDFTSSSEFQQEVVLYFNLYL